VDFAEGIERKLVEILRSLKLVIQLDEGNNVVNIHLRN
jgi:hypothetical protein